MKFINWKEVPAEPKNKKVPWSASLGYEIDPHDPSQWLTHEQAVATGMNVGIVLTDSDPWFLLDLDNCRDPETGQWTPEAMEVASMFPGSAQEVSFNGTGMHVMGKVDPIRMGERRNKFKYGHAQLELEFYHNKRFVALGHGMQGNIDIDWTDTLMSIVPTRDKVTTVELIDECDPAYTGPEDDQKLIQIILNARGSANQVFGNTASPANLWERDVEVLGRVFPSPSGKEFDGNSADLALMSHLAFYTGRNSARMDRLYRLSGLCREKYLKRPKYAIDTISAAVSGCKKVYDKPREQIIQADDARLDEFGSIVTLQEIPDYFKGCVYVAHEHKVMVPGGSLFKPTVFNAMYGGHQFIMDTMGTKPTYNAFEAFTENRGVRFPKVMSTCFRPMSKPGLIIGDAVNVYNPEIIDTTQGSVEPFLDLVRKLLPHELDQQIMLAYMAALVQYQGKKFLWAPVVQGTKGNGKNFLAECLIYCIGERYSWSPKSSKIDAQFNTFLRNRILITVSEMHMFSKYEMLETLKDYITEHRQEVEGKGTNSEMVSDYCANWFFLTNHKDAVIKERDDRRFAMFFTAQQSREDMVACGMLSDNYFPNLWNWARQGGYSAIRHYLLHYAIPDELNPAGDCIIAPDTSSTVEAISASYGVAEQYILESVASDEQGFRGGWVSTWAVSKMLEGHGIRRAPRKLASMIESLGYVSHGRSPVKIMQEENSRPTLWSNKNATMEYHVAQLYSKPDVRRVG